MTNTTAISEASYMDAMQGSNENRASCTRKYSERGAQAADAAARHEAGQMAALPTFASRYGGYR